MKQKKRDDSAAVALKPSARPLISVCMIVKNEEKYIDQCLRSIKLIADEIIFVDTGSTDRTVEIAGNYTDKIYFHPWNDNFSEARNQSMSYATGDWIFIIDADEELVKEDIPQVLNAVKNEKIDAIKAQVISTAHEGRSKAVHNSERILRNNGVTHYEGRVHNRLVGITSSETYPIRILHYGYDILDGNIGKKFDRTVALLKKDLDDNPDNPVTHHYLSCSYLSRGMNREAIEHGQRAIALAEAQNNQAGMFLWTHYNISLAYYRLKNLNMAREKAVAALKKHPGHIDSHFMMIVICFDEMCWQDLIFHANRYLRLIDDLNEDPARFGNIVNCSLNEEWNIHILLGIAFVEMERAGTAKKSFEKAVQTAPDPFLALRAVGIYSHKKNRMASARSYLEQARQLNENDETVNQLLADIFAMNSDFQNEPTISCCMIVRDEEDFLEPCLESIKDFVDELIIVDTGSIDKTVDIARRYTEKVYFHEWKDSFSEARNHAMSFATGDWILTIDADEELISGSGSFLRQAVRAAGSFDAIYATVISIYSGGRKTARHNSERVLRNNGIIHYEGRVHNRLVGITKTVISKVEIMHYGYNVDEKKANEKFSRTVELLKNQILERPDDPMPHHYLGASYLARGMYRESIAESTLAISLAKSQGKNDDIYLSTHYHAAFAFYHLTEFIDAREYSLAALAIFPDHLDSLYMLTIISGEDRKWSDLLGYGLRFLELRDDFEKHPEKTGVIINSTISEGAAINVLVGHAYHALKNDAAMAGHYETACRISASKWQTCCDIGAFHLDRSGDLKRSRHYLELALLEGPEEPAVWHALAKWNGEAANDHDEKRCLSKLFELGSYNVKVLDRLAALSLAADDLQTAQQALNALMIMEPHNLTALCNFGLLYRRQNALDRAMEAFGKVIEINPQETAPWLNLGEIALQLGELDNARLFFERVFNLGAEQVKTLLYLCEIELRQERIAEFIHWCDLLLKELHLNRARTIHSIEDLSVIMNEIHMSLTNAGERSQIAKILTLLPGRRH